MRRGLDTPNATPPPHKVPPPCPSRWPNGGRGKGHGSNFKKFFFGVGDLKISLKVTFDLWPGDDEEGHLEP